MNEVEAAKSWLRAIGQGGALVILVLVSFKSTNLDSNAQGRSN
jgi:hypothetical protein